MGFYLQDHFLTIEVESGRILWNLIESCPVTIEVGFLQMIK